jgi:hypothetical protein
MKRKVFTKDFKLEAVRLLESSGRAASEVARELAPVCQPAAHLPPGSRHRLSCLRGLAITR